MKHEFSQQIFENFLEDRPVGAELSHAGGQSDTQDEPNSSFSQFREGVQKLIV
jgi:hypothetical protein